MALTISIEGKGIIANANAYASDSAGGTWGELGGGSIGFNPDVYIYGAGSIGNQYASKSGYSYYNTPTSLDFDTAGTEEGQFIYLWVNIQSKGPFDTLANNGFSIRIGTSLSDYRDFKIAGKNDANGWAGGWKCFVLDPTKAGSVNDTGTFDVGNVNYIGLWVDTDVSVRADSIFIDQIAVGSGLRITGTSTTGWKDVVDYCTDYTNRAWGMFEEREGIYYCKGKIYIGDETNQSANVSFADSGRSIQFETSEYWSGSAWVSSVPTNAFGIIIEDHASWKTDFTDGVIVGTEKGRSGSTIRGNSNENIIIDLYGGNNTGSASLCYGTTFKVINGTFNAGDDTDHKFLGCSFIECAQFDPCTVDFKNNLILATSDADGGLLLDESGTDNMSDLSFISDGSGHGVYMDSTGTFTFDNIVFSGYGATGTADASIYNNSGGEVIINATNGSTGLTYKNGAGASTVVNNAVTLTLKIIDEDGSNLQDAWCYIEDSSQVQLMNEQSLSTGISTETYNYISEESINIRVRKYGYKAYRSDATITASGLNVTITMISDPQQT